MLESGLKQIFLTMEPALVRYLLARGLSQDDAADMVQDLYLKLDGHHPTGPINEPRAYLYRMTHNLLLDRRRSAERRVRREEEWVDGVAASAPDVDGHPSAEDALIARERLFIVGEALKSLSERTRDIFRRFRLEGETQRAIADDLGISKSAVEKHLYRAYDLVSQTRARLDADDDAISPPRLRHRSKRHERDE